MPANVYLFDRLTGSDAIVWLARGATPTFGDGKYCHDLSWNFILAEINRHLRESSPHGSVSHVHSPRGDAVRQGTPRDPMTALQQRPICGIAFEIDK
jgi:hypothetical protein